MFISVSQAFRQCFWISGLWDLYTRKCRFNFIFPRRSVYLSASFSPRSLSHFTSNKIYPPRIYILCILFQNESYYWCKLLLSVIIFITAIQETHFFQLITENERKRSGRIFCVNTYSFAISDFPMKFVLSKAISRQLSNKNYPQSSQKRSSSNNSYFNNNKTSRRICDISVKL